MLDDFLDITTNDVDIVKIGRYKLLLFQLNQKVTQINCFCGTPKSFETCCQPYIKGVEKASTAEVLMRSRYTAYATHSVDYLLETTHFSTRKLHAKDAILDWATKNQWLKLEIIQSAETTVEFKAYFLDHRLQTQIHHEKSTFAQENGNWFYVDGLFFI